MTDTFKSIRNIYHSANSWIYRGINTCSDTEVVIKVLNRAEPTPVELGRFRNEYKLANKVEHPNVIKNFDITTFNGAPAIVMEDFGGESLDRFWNSSRRGLKEKLSVSYRVAAAIEAIHENNIIHKDINPANIVWCPVLDVVKIIDFGISTEQAEERCAVQNPTALEGTLAFMSPEQTGRMNRSVDHRSDLYCLGATLYWLFTGRAPFDERDPLRLIYAQIANTPIPPCQINAQIPDAVSSIILKLMAKDAGGRYQSISGVKYDLDQCRRKLRDNGTIDYFEMGKKDIPTRFRTPASLYGRETEIQAVRSAFERVCEQKTPEFTLVSGASGVGKTDLVGEVNKEVAARNGFFLSGKFDQMAASIPHNSIIQTFGELFEHLLAEPKEKLSQWKKSINAAVHPNGKIITDVIEGAQLVLGSQPGLIDLPPLEAGNRFNHVMKHLVAVFAKKEHPLVLFFDDLQWSDASTLRLMQGLLLSKIQYLYVIGAYRDNEIDKTHRLTRLIEKVKSQNIPLSEIKLNPLNLNIVNTFIMDAMQTGDPIKTAPLAELCHIKTKGNPLHLVQLMADLNANGVFSYDLKGQQWQWDKEKIAQLDIMDDAVAFMMSKLQRLSQNAQKTIMTAACIDTFFDIEKIKHACAQDAVKTFADLSEAIEQGFIIPSQNYKYMDEHNSDIDIEFRFFHDRVRQAAYDLIGEGDKQRRHKKIGERFLAQLRRDNPWVSLFDVAKQLNCAAGAIVEKSERIELARLNLDAGKKAKTSTVWKQAFQHFEAGLNVLSDDDWQSHYDLAFALHAGAADAACIIPDFEAVERIAEPALEKAITLLDKCIIWEIQISALIARGRPEEATKLGISVLNRLGIKIKLNTPKPVLVLSLLKTKIGFKKIERVLAENNMTDPHMLAASRILMRISPSAYLTGKKALFSIVLNSVKLIEKNGYYTDTAFGLVSFASILSAIGDKKTALKFAKLALTIAEKNDAKPMRAKTIYLATTFTLIWNAPYKDLSANLINGYQSGIETGDAEFAAFNIFCHFYLRFIGGEALGPVAAGMIAHADKIRNQDSVWSMFCLYLQLICNLRGDAVNSIRLTGAVCDEDEIISRFEGHGNKMGLFDLYTKKLMLACLFYRYCDGEQISGKIDNYVDAALVKHDLPIAVLYQSLLIIEGLRSHAGDSRKKLKRLKQYIRKMRRWANHAPANYLHKHLLMTAEAASVSAKAGQASVLYEKAIQAAEQSGIVHETALCWERMALHCKLQGDHHKYEQAIIASFEGYKDWGALGKCRAMKSRYPDILTQKLKYIHDPSQRSVFTEASSAHDSNDATQLSTFDLLTVIRASQIISKEMDIGRLSDSLIDIVVENAGAQKCALLVQNQTGQMVIQSIYHSQKEDKTNYPESVINYAVRTKKVVAIDDAAVSKYSGDPYFDDHQIRSALCIPLVRSNRTTAALYLENNLSTNAFAKDRVLLLKTIASQASILVENSLLYSAVAKSEARYRGIVENAPDGIFQSTPRGKLITANKALAEMLGYESPDQMVREVDDLALSVYADPTSRESIKTEIETDGCVKDFEVELQKKNGTGKIIGLLNAYAVRDDIGKLVYYEGSIRDVTEKKQIETLKLEKKKAEIKASTKSRFLAHMSHEIRTPINTILGYSDLLKNFADQWQVPDKETLSDYTDTIVSSGRHLLALINEILDFSKLESGTSPPNYQCFSISSTMADIDHQYRDKIETKGVKFNLEMGPCVKDLMIKFDETKLKKILYNLIDNADKYTQRGSINVSVRNRRMGKNKLDMIWSVEDSGIGIAETGKIFEEFEQLPLDENRVNNGAGLGLAIVKREVQLLNGDVTVKSTLGKGSVFRLVFKSIEIAQQPWGLEKNDTPKVLFAPANIIVADDHAKNRKLIKDYITLDNIVVLEAENGNATIDMLEQNRIDMVLMDLKMPLLDGYQVTKKIKANPNTCHVPIIALTADITPASKSKAMSCGCDGYLLKPVSRNDLIAEMKRFLAHRIADLSEPQRASKKIRKIKIDYNPKQQPKLLQSLVEAQTTWCKLCDAMIISDVEQFAADMVSVGKKHRSVAIVQWGEKLREHAGHFNKKKIDAMMQDFPQIIKKIESADRDAELSLTD